MEAHMGKRNMVQSNLVKNSIAAYFAAIELHNKPNISYRYETVVILLINAWELALKAYIRKYIKKRSIYEPNGHTITIDKALAYVAEDINSKKPNGFSATKSNIEKVEEYRNKITHFYCVSLDPFVFMLVARLALNYVEFMKEYFSRDIMDIDGLFILPLGFKLPFRPTDFLSKNYARFSSSPAAQEFIKGIITTTQTLKNEGIEDSIVLGFEVYLESVKKAKNSDILAAITTLDEADVTVARRVNVTFSNDPTAQIVQLSDAEFRANWKYNHSQLVALCREKIPGFKVDRHFNSIKAQMKSDANCVYKRRLDSQNSKSPSQDFYTDLAVQRITEEYEKKANS